MHPQLDRSHENLETFRYRWQNLEVGSAYIVGNLLRIYLQISKLPTHIGL